VHIPLVCFGIAFPVLVLVAEYRYLRTGDPLYRALARRWSRIMLALFAVGVVTGTILSHDPVHPESAPAEEAALSPAASLAGTAPAAPPARLWGAAAVVGLVAGTGLLVFLDPAWAHGLGVACLVLCAVAVFRLASSPPAPWTLSLEDYDLTDLAVTTGRTRPLPGDDFAHCATPYARNDHL
jgi:hypothetical protein